MPIHPNFRSTPAEEQVFFQCIAGHPEEVLAQLNRQVGQLARHWGYHRKVGITNRPHRRWREAYRYNGWEYMTVLYESPLHEHVCDLERAIETRFREGVTTSPGYFYNATGGGGGRKPNGGPFYLYLVTAQRHARITSGTGTD